MAGEASLYGSLFPDENTYLADSPWFGAGVSVLRSPTPQPRNNTEAFLLPILQGLGGGLMTGYGRNQADQQMETDYKSQLAQLLGNDAPTLPEDFSPQNAKMTVAKALYDYNQKQEIDQKKYGLLSQLIQQDPQAGIQAAKNLGIDFGDLPPIQDTAKTLRQKQLEEIQQRFDATKADRDAQLQFPGFEYDMTKIRPTPAEAAKVRSELESNAILKETLGALKDSIDEQGFMNLFGNNAQLQGALGSYIFNTYRKATESGARLEGPEGKMIQSMTPAVLANDFPGAIKAALTGRSPSQLATDMVKAINQSEDALMKARYGAKRIPNVGILEEQKTEIARPRAEDFKNFADFKAAKDAWRAAGGG